MNKRLVLYIAGFVFLLSFRIVSANILINEIMYDVEGTDTDREWIEVYNGGSASVDLSTYKFFEADSNHGLTLEEGLKDISAGGYAVIVLDKAKFKIDNPNFTGNIFRASFSLNNEGEALSIKDTDLNVSDSYSYLSSTGGAGDGKSLQKINNSWKASTPTAGKANSSSENTNQNSNDAENTSQTNSTNTSTQSGGSIKTNLSIRKTETTIIAPIFAFANLPIVLDAKTFGQNGEELRYGKYFWNFGDGTSFDLDAIYANKFSHTYFYAGEYVVALEYYSNAYSLIPIATDNITIKVVPASIIISNVGKEQDFFLELTNNTEYSVDMGGWYISSLSKTFVFPKNTILQSKKKIILSPKITNFVFEDEKNLKLFNLSSELVFDYGAYKNPVIKPTVKKVAVNGNISNTKIEMKTENRGDYTSFQLRNDLQENNLEASVVASTDDTDNIKKNKNFLVLGLTFLVLLGAGGVYFIRRKGRENDSNEGDDFDIES